MQNKCTNSNANFKYVMLSLAVFFLIGCHTAACQPTPEKEAVANKSESLLSEKVNDTASLQTDEDTDNSEKWAFNKDYDSGITLIVDAVVRNAKTTDIPVISLDKHKFESGDSLKQIVEVFYPDKEIYDLGEISKQDIEEQIVHYQNLLSRLEQGLPLHPEDPGLNLPVPEDRVEYYRDTFNNIIRDLEKQYIEAPDKVQEITNFQLRYIEESDSYQANMWTKSHDKIVDFNFVNWDWGASCFYLTASSPELDNLDRSFSERFLTPESLESDADFQEVKKDTDEFVAKMGLDYMSLNAVSKNTKTRSYNLYYTREYQGMQETYVNNYLGTTATGIDGAPMIELWKNEFLQFEVLNNEVVKVRWENASQISSVDNDNVKALSWEEAKDIFKQQIDYTLSAATLDGSPPKTVYIDRIEFGLTKVLMKNSRDDYKLVPTWSFMGYEDNGDELGGITSVCYLTINAIDGSIIDRGLMH